MDTNDITTEFTTVTELPGIKVHSSQLSAVMTRYKFGKHFSHGKDVLEIACGSGMGLGYLAETAHSVVGGDIDKECLRVARETYKNDKKVDVISLDADNMTFADRSFDTIILFEAHYYLNKPDTFFHTARRILRPGGHLVIVNANRESVEFNSSPYSVNYFSAQDLKTAMQQQGFEVDIRVGFPVTTNSLIKNGISLIRRLAVHMHLIPKTMRGKELLKRLFYGQLTPMPRLLQANMGSLEPLHDAPEGTSPICDFKVIYAVGKLPEHSDN